MLQTVEGVYRNGTIELSETAREVSGEVRVLVTFMGAGQIDLRQRGIDERQAADLRGRLCAFHNDSESPEMDDYDDYDTNRRNLVAG